MIGKATFIASKFGGKAWTKIKTTGQKVPSWVKSNLKAIKDLRGPATKYVSKVTTRYKKLPESYKTGIKVAGVLGATGAGITGAMALSPKLKKNDPRYKALKKHGYV